MRANSVVGAKSIESLLDVLKRVPEHRTREGRLHPLHAILALAVVATICGCKGQRGIAAWGRLQPPKVRKALGFTRRKTPAHSTLHDVLKALDVAAFERALRSWAAGHDSITEAQRRFAARPMEALALVRARLARRRANAKAVALAPAPAR